MADRHKSSVDVQPCANRIVAYFTARLRPLRGGNIPAAIAAAANVAMFIFCLSFNCSV